VRQERLFGPGLERRAVVVKSRSIAVRCTVVVTAACLAGPAAVGGGSAAASPVDPGSPVTTRVSMSSVGVQGNNLSGIYSDISADGRYVVFSTKASNLVRGDTNGTGTCSCGTDVPTHGRHVAFASGASNLVAGDSHDAWDEFVRTRGTG
jgi:hypothetical protein